MPSNQSARLGLPYLAAGQLQKHVTANEGLTRLDVLAQTAVVSRSLAVQPADPEDGALYILAADPTGAAWGGWSEGDLVRAEMGGWTRVPTPVGALAVVLDEGLQIVRGPEAWNSFPARLGINTTADGESPFAAKVNKALWAALSASEGGDGDLRFTMNKEGSADTLSLLFQSGWGGRAEIGLVGDDDLRLKVSADGAVWRETLRVDRETGRAWFASGAGRAEVVGLSASGDFTPPDWARVLTVTALGGGGSGGGGAFGASGLRQGGGGGGGGGLSQATWRVEDLPGGLTVAVGAGGAAGGSGGDTTISSAGVQLMKALGGGAGQAGASGGDSGAAGLGTVGGNRGGGASAIATASPGESLISPAASGGGGGGGGLDASNTARSGGTGGAGGVLVSPGAGGAGGGGPGAAGAASLTLMSASGGGGGGGGAGSSGAGFHGGAGGGHGAGGGGGGAGLTAGGAGGAGAPGIVLILIQG